MTLIGHATRQIREVPLLPDLKNVDHLENENELFYSHSHFCWLLSLTVYTIYQWLCVMCVTVYLILTRIIR